MVSLEKESDRQAMENVREFRKGLLCSICNEFLSDTYNLPCGHSFCRECIDDALAERNSCPDCMNPAWQKDTLKMALTDSTVQDWVANCERLYQAHVARQAARDGESSDTDSDLALVEASSGDDERGGTDIDEEEEGGGNVAPIAVPSAPPPPPQQQPPARQAAPENEGVVGAAAAAAPSLPLPAAAEPLPCRSLKGAEKENNAASGSWGAATATSSADLSVAAAAPTAGVVGVERAAAWSSSPSSSFSGQNRTPRVRFQPSPLRACAAPSEAGQKGSGRQEEEASVHPRREKLPPAAAVTKPRDSSPLVLEGTVKAGDVVDARLPTEGEKLRSTPAAAPLNRSVANTAAASPPGTESERRESTPPRGTLVVTAKDPGPSPSVVPEKPAAVEREEGGSSFAVGLPDTCDIFDAESSPPHSPIASTTTTTTMLILTPPTLKPGGPETKAAPRVGGTSAEGGTSTDVGVGGGGGGLGGVELGDSGSEDGVSDAESVPLLGANARLKDVNGQKPQQQQKQQHGSGRTWPSDGVPSPSSRSPLAGSGVDRPDETTVRHRSTAANDEEGEETCDEADSLSNYGGSGAALGDCGRGEQPTTGVEDERANEAVSLEATGPSKDVDPSSSPSRVPLVLTNGGEVPKRPATHGAASGAAEKTSPAKGTGVVDSVRPGCQAPTASPRHDKLFPDGQRSAAVASKEAELSSTTRVDSPQPVSGSLQRQPQAFTAPSEASVLHDEQSAAKGDVLARREGRSLDGGELCVAETLPQTPGLGGDVLDKHAVVASPGDDGDTTVPETSAQGGLATDVLEPNPPKSLAGGVIAGPAGGTPGVEQPEGGGVGEAFEGGKEDPNVARLEVPDSCVAHADGQEEHHASGGGTASDGLDGRGPVRAEQLGDKNTRGSSVAAAALAAPQPGVKGGGRTPSSQAAPLQQRRSPENATTRVDSPGLKTGSSADGRLRHDSDEVPETLPSQRVGVDAGDGRGSSAAAPDVCLATQELSEQRESTRCSDDHGPELGRRIPETAAQTSTTQEIQSLTTQEVPETAHAWGSVGACGGSSSSRIDGVGSAASGSYSQSEVLETEQLHGGATQGTADCAGGVGASGVGDGVEEQGAARFRRGAIAQSQQPQQPPPLQQQQSKSMPPSSSTLPAEAVVGGTSRDEVGGVKSCAGLGDGEKPGEAWASPGSLRADEAAGVHGGVRDGGSPKSLVPTERTPDGSGNRKRSADYATLSPSSRLSCDPGSAGKRTRLTPPPYSAANPSARPGAAASDVEASCNDDKPPDGGSPWQDAGRGSQQGRPIALRGGSGPPGSDDESEMPDTDHDLAAVQDAWHAEGGYEFGDDGGYLEDQTEETESGRLPSSPAGDDSPPRKPRKNQEVDNPYAPQAHLDLSHGGDDFQPAARADGMMSPPVGGVEESGKKPRSSRTAARRPSKSTMGFGSPSFGGAVRISPSLSGSRFAASLNDSNRRPIKNRILAAGREHGLGGTTPASLSVPDKSGTWSSFNDLGPDTEEVENLQARVAEKRAQEKAAAGSAAPETNSFDPSDAEYEEGGESDDDGSWTGRGEQNHGHRQGWDTRRDSSSENKRKRTAMAAAAAAATTTASEGRGTKVPREARHDRGDDGRPRRRRSPVLIVLLGCSPREQKRANELCARLGQRRPETELVSGATQRCGWQPVYAASKQQQRW
ncbi:conserved unknown protein [Ectocarpus siliculosus]|uniref:RING-type domain-containing protein n=1 Tax=Ectocarpus siliculosus TaxID=2880 RepID=D7FV25_ECTSI|nr:conserved unknown protein [Ectocarpus siliculosus]|eukprot:CBJ31831.1 conserved unknown protein [Ectocarpus siliculosus]